MSQTKTTAQDDGTISFDELPDARIAIDLKRVSGGWVAFDPDDDTSITGRADSAPRAAEDYCRRVAEYLEGSDLSADRERSD